ncbi:palmdelphin-like [Melanotaenia boesemani]|uniref:palmdelphin-like n=1 Tax=Melanotaenia boesemani TaxID=1250792 RepID=UPI001C050FBD|nr:palmdelphin-like [Melanotaenia boesemani]
MEDSDLLRERFHAITAKHRIQEYIHQKKLELDQEKLKLQHLRKMILKEQWLLQESEFFNTQQQDLASNYSQTRALQLSIHRTEKEVECLERQEGMISANECFILNRLKALQKGPDDIIKEANRSFVLEPLQVTKVMPGDPDVPNPPANKPNEPSTQERGSHNQRCISEQVEQSPGSATMLCQIKQQNYHLNPNKRKERGFPNPRDEREDQEGRYRNHILKGTLAETDFTSRGRWRRNPHDELCYCHHAVNHEGQGHYHGNGRDHNYSQYSNSMSRHSRVINDSSSSRQLPQRSQHQEGATAHQPQQSSAPDSLIPADDNIHELDCQTPPSRQATRVPSLVLVDHSPCTMLSSLQITEPITAIFMGFQTAQDDSGQVQEFEGILKAELILIQDNKDHGEASSMTETKDCPQVPTGHSASRNVGDGDRWTERRLGVRKIKESHKPCCSVC